MSFLNLTTTLAMALILLAMAICLIRLWRGPTLADRVVALDMMTTSIVAFCAVFAVRTGLDAFLDIAVTLALVSFVSVVALARYAERLAPKGGPR